jgi:hypothetical protein
LPIFSGSVIRQNSTEKYCPEHLQREHHKHSNLGYQTITSVRTNIFPVTHNKGPEDAVKLNHFHILMSILGFSNLREDCIGKQQLCQYMESTST